MEIIAIVLLQALLTWVSMTFLLVILVVIDASILQTDNAFVKNRKDINCKQGAIDTLNSEWDCAISRTNITDILDWYYKCQTYVGITNVRPESSVQTVLC
jgi:hypothetical protein